MHTQNSIEKIDYAPSTPSEDDVAQVSTSPDQEPPFEASAPPAGADPQPIELLRALWRCPDAHHLIATPKGSAPEGFRCRHVSEYEQCIDESIAISQRGHDGYFACAEFKSTSRVAKNAIGAWAFWADVDCGEQKFEAGKGYATLEQASAGLSEFCSNAQLPEPTHLVHSGGGLHAYWILGQFVEASTWMPYARKLKALFAAHGYMADPTRTADLASLLRIPGTLNHKHQPPRMVVLVQTSAHVDRDLFLSAIDAACTSAGLNETQPPSIQNSSAVRVGVDIGRIRSVVERIDPDRGYDDWCRVLMGVHTETSGSEEGLALVTEWSRKGAKFKGEGELRSKWRSFRLDVEHPITLGTLVDMANEDRFTPQPTVIVEAGLKKRSTEKRPSAMTGAATSPLEARTHNGYAKLLLGHYKVEGWEPVAQGGILYAIDGKTYIWTPIDASALMKKVADLYDGRPGCSRATDYRQIAAHAVEISQDIQFFAEAATGLACGTQFYAIANDQVLVEDLSPSHRQRVSVDYIPARMPTPMFDQFLTETFKSENDKEQQEQIGLLQEVAGAIMTGIMCRYQKAILFYDPYGRSGKGTVVQILQQLVPDEFVTSVTPTKWNQEYYIAELAGSRLNIVGELPDSPRIPADCFKSVLGGDLVMGRSAYSRPTRFRNEAAHLFMSNNLITSTENSEAFFARWMIIEFPNSRLKLNLPLDPGLPEKIIKAEMPGIAYWALEGARRVLANGKFSASSVSDRLIAKSRRGNSSVEEFIHDACDLDASYKVRRADLFTRYKSWCSEVGRVHLARSRFYSTLDHTLGLNIHGAKLDGHDIYRGVKLKDESRDPLELDLDF